MLYVDKGQNLLDDPNVEKDLEDSETFSKNLNDFVENQYKGVDSSELLKLFTPKQRNILDRYFKMFTKEEYEALNGSVALEIKQKDENVERKIKEIEGKIGHKINRKDWVYDGLRDMGNGNRDKCDFCSHTVRYVHFAINKKTKDTLQFGSNCVADFFRMSPSTIASLNTLAGKTLRDIKIIACVVQTNKYKEYYKYMCGYVGDVLRKGGIQAVKDLMPFEVYFDNGELRGNDAQGYDVSYVIDKQPVKKIFKKDLNWIKENITSCVNADLGGSLYETMAVRKVVPSDKLADKKSQDEKESLAISIRYAAEFLDNNLPIPLTLVKKINMRVASLTKKGHPDYMKYAQDLLMNKNFKESRLLLTAFTDFIVNYLASSVGLESRDAELSAWGVRGQGTFYKTVLLWEKAIGNLILIRDLRRIMNEGWVPEYVKNRRRYSRSYISADQLRYIDNIAQNVMYGANMDKNIELYLAWFLSVKKLNKKQSNLSEGKSKYEIQGQLENLRVALPNVGKDTNFDYAYVDGIPYIINMYAISYLNWYREAIKYLVDYPTAWLKCISVMDNDMLSKMLASTEYVDGVFVNDFYKRKICEYILYTLEYLNRKDAVSYLQRVMNKEVRYDVDLAKYILETYGNVLDDFRKTCNGLYEKLEKIRKNLSSDKVMFKYKKSEILDDFDEMTEQEKKAKDFFDYFDEYKSLLAKGVGDKTIQSSVKTGTYNDILIFEDIRKYKDMLKDICVKSKETSLLAEERRIYKYLDYDKLNSHLTTLFDGTDEDLIRLMLISWCIKNKELRMLCDENGSKYSEKNDYLIRYSPLKEIQKKLKDGIIVVRPVYSEKETFYYLNKELEDVLDNLRTLKSGLSKENDMLYADVLNILPGDVSAVKAEMRKGMPNADFVTLVENKLGKKPNYDANLTAYSDIYAYLRAFTQFRGLEDAFDRFENAMKYVYENLWKVHLDSEEKDKEAQEKLLKAHADFFTYFSEHEKYYDFDVDAYRKANAGDTTIARKSDNDIRRMMAYHNVKFSNSKERLQDFIAESEREKDSQTPDSVKYLNIAKEAIEKDDFYTIKAMADVMKSDLYNRELIYNHYDSAMKDVYSALRSVGFDKLSLEELQTLTDILKDYFIFKSDVLKMISIIEAHGLIYDMSFIKYFPAHTMVDLNERYSKSPFVKGEDGLNVCEKAEKIAGSSGFFKLSTRQRWIIRVVKDNKAPNERQAEIVNDIYNKMFGAVLNDDTAPKTDSDLIDGFAKCDDAFNLPYEEAVETIKRAHQLLQYAADGEDIAKFSLTVANTLESSYVQKIAKCTAKQKTWIDKAYKEREAKS